jgi:hypothetical protein
MSRDHVAAPGRDQQPPDEAVAPLHLRPPHIRDLFAVSAEISAQMIDLQ